MKRQRMKTMARLLLLLAVLWLILTTVSCTGNVYMGVGVAGPYVGYPYGGAYGYPYGGTVWVGRPF